MVKHIANVSKHRMLYSKSLLILRPPLTQDTSFVGYPRYLGLIQYILNYLSCLKPDWSVLRPRNAA
jgi:hypothetical protein